MGRESLRDCVRIECVMLATVPVCGLGSEIGANFVKVAVFAVSASEVGETIEVRK